MVDKEAIMKEKKKRDLLAKKYLAQNVEETFSEDLDIFKHCI